MAEEGTSSSSSRRPADVFWRDNLLGLVVLEKVETSDKDNGYIFGFTKEPLKV